MADHCNCGTFNQCPSCRPKPPTFGPQYCPECNDQAPQAVTRVYDWGTRNEQWLIVLACGHKFTFLKDRAPA